ncbi:MAG: ribonuclease activity regulator RraA [Devosia sp.]|nr:ribonuclease activity regulator RraA [Devosia sp.]
MTLSEQSRAKFAAVSTATLTSVLLKRGLRNTFIGGVHLINPDAPRMVGPAFTLRYIPSREDLDHTGVFDGRKHPQRIAIETCPEGHVMVFDSRKDASAASAGGILVARLYSRGIAGAVTDGGFRDTPDIAKLPFAVYHSRPSAPTNLIKHHALDINQPIGCGDVPVYPGDIMVGDGEGVVVVPQHLADEVADEAFEQTVYEDFVQEKILAGASTFGVYPAEAEAKAEFQKWRAAHGR